MQVQERITRKQASLANTLPRSPCTSPRRLAVLTISPETVLVAKHKTHDINSTPQQRRELWLWGSTWLAFWCSWALEQLRAKGWRSNRPLTLLRLTRRK